ncbi:MAG TPA: RNA-binding protein [Firmicutes bacterium]|nr:RNA-binding protein [Bacillota bacterium]
MKEPPKIGALVHSLAGRDSGGYYLVVGYAGPRTVLVANGENRPLKNPKKKNLRHLQLHHDGPAPLAERIRQRKARDEEIARAIREMVGVEPTGGEREGNKPDV